MKVWSVVAPHFGPCLAIEKKCTTIEYIKGKRRIPIYLTLKSSAEFM